jgi:cell fate regulator YaaT (PSP1 superfamily)
MSITKDSVYVIETKHGQDFGTPVISPIPIKYIKKSNKNDPPKIIRQASFDDLKVRDSLRKRETKSFKIALEKIKKHKLPMKLINIYHFFDGGKVLFNFYADGRVDFRNLVKDLASVFKTRIELHQVGVRDEAQLTGGFGVCGIQYCCQMLKTNKEPISIKMAKEQNLPLNAMKISGACGRLMCCLDFEFSDYKEQHKKELLETGSIVTYGNKPYVVKQINMGSKEIILSGEGDDYQIVNLKDIKHEDDKFYVEVNKQ